jgi:nucleotide-binding universal stress UspA family protein
MKAIKQILCPVDFSDFSRHALDQAVAIARQFRASVTALYVVPPISSWYPPLDAGSFVPYVYTPEDLAEFQRSVEKFVADAGYEVKAVSAEAPVVDEILGQAAALPADLIVMGTHGRSGFERVLLGSVAERVLAKAPCPVLTVPRRTPDAVPFAHTLYPNILCGVDFSPSSLHALAFAASFAAETGASLTTMHVLAKEPRMQPVMMGAPRTPEYHQMQRDIAREHLHDALPADARGSVPVTELIIDGKASDELVRVAMERQADLIVVGAHGGPAGLFGFGSTTNSVVRWATCPVLTVRA